MSTVTQSFTGTGNGNGLSVRTGQSYSYLITGTFVGTWVVEETTDGINYIETATGTNVASSTIVQVERRDNSNINTRFRVPTYTSGTITTELADQEDLVDQSILRDHDGLTIMRIRDGKAEFPQDVDITGDVDVTGDLTKGGTLVLIEADNIVYVHSMSDFPAAVAGVITLVNNTQYNIQVTLTTSDRFVLPTGSTISFMFAAFNITQLTYTGIGTLFTGVDIGALQLFDAKIDSTSGSATLWAVDGVGAAGVSQIAVNTSRFDNWNSLGTITDLNFNFFSSAHLNSGGITLTDCRSVRLDNSVVLNFSDLSSTFFTFDGTADVSINIGDMRIPTFSGETVFDFDTGLGSDTNIKLIGNDFSFVTGQTGTVLDATGILTTDVRMASGGNDNLRNSRTIGSMISQGNDVATVISTQGLGESNYEDLDLGEATGSITVYADNGSGGTTVTSTAHGEPEEKLVEITGSTSYNGRHEIFSVVANTFDIDVAFVADDATGTWTAGAFSDVDIERWELNDASNGELKYIGQEPFSGEVVVTISAVASGGSPKRYKFRLVKNGVNGFAIPNEIRNTITETTLRKGISVVTDDLIKVQVANFQDTSNITIDTVSLGIE